MANVSDDLYEFTLSVETSCKQHFNVNSFHKHKWDSCKIGREEVRKDPMVTIAFNKLMSTIDADESGDSTIDVNVKGAIQSRIMKRYLNMRCKEFVKVIKREMKCEKSKEHRKKVQEKKNKAKNGGKDVLRQLTEDHCDNKTAEFFTLKAMAAKGKNNFTKMTKNELHFICHLFGIKFKESETKDKLSSVLINKINYAQEMTHPTRCTTEELNAIHARKNKKCASCDANREVLGILTNIANVSNSVQASQLPLHSVPPNNLPMRNNPEATTKVRQKQFRPTDGQKTILQQDHSNGITAEVIKQRAAEFTVDVSQIRSWHKRFRLKEKSRA